MKVLVVVPEAVLLDNMLMEKDCPCGKTITNISPSRFERTKSRKVFYER